MSGKRIQNLTEKTKLVDADMFIIADSEDLTGSYLNSKKISNFNVLKRTAITIGSIGGGTQDLDLDLGEVFIATVDTATTTFTFSNPTTTGYEHRFKILLTDGESQTVNWPASVKWAGGIQPTLTASGVDLLEFVTFDAGTNWYGYVLALDLS